MIRLLLSCCVRRRSLLGRSVVADLIATIGPGGAGARVLQSGLQLTFDSAGAIYVPGLEYSSKAGAPVRLGGACAIHAQTDDGKAAPRRSHAALLA